MPLDRDTLVFGINNTENRYYGASLADQLDGSILKRTQPQFFFPPDWVLEHSKGPVDEAAFAVRYCDDSAALATIARRERRLAVMKALASSSYLSADSFDDVLLRTGDEHHRTLRYLRANAVDNAEVYQSPEEEIAALLVDDRTYDVGVNGSRYVSVLERVAELSSSRATLADDLLRGEAARGKFAYAAGYLEHYYINISEQKKALSLVTLSPEEIVGLHVSPEVRDRLLSGLVRNLDYSDEQVRPLDLAITQLIATAVITPPSELAYDYDAREMFCADGVDVLIGTPGWHVFLERQTMSDEQFARLVASVQRVAAPEHVNDLFRQLHGSRDRLIVLLGAVAAISSDAVEASMALECLDGPNDELLTKVFDLSDEYIVTSYIKGEYTIGAKHEVLIPEIAELPSLVKALIAKWPTAFEGFSYFIRYNLNNTKVSEEYVAALVECVPGLAFELRGDSTYSSDIYQLLMSTGIREDEVLEAFYDAKELSLRSLRENLLASLK